ncbi:MAG: TIGR00725 family protein [candidate division WOR-3 bacterium]
MKGQVAVIGASECSKEEWDVAYEVGRLIAKSGWVLVCGGRGGVMEAACKGAYEEGGITVGILTTTTGEDANPYVKIKINTGMGHNRNPIVVLSGDFVVAIGGRWGTLSELAYSKIYGKPVIGYKTLQIEGIENYEDFDGFFKRLEVILLDFKNV